MAPKTKSVAASAATLLTMASTGRHPHSTSPLIPSTARQPKRVASAPPTGMARMEPMPRHSSTRPSWASFTPVAALADGTSEAQAATARPDSRKIIRVAFSYGLPAARGWEDERTDEWAGGDAFMNQAEMAAEAETDCGVCPSSRPAASVAHTQDDDRGAVCAATRPALRHDLAHASVLRHSQNRRCAGRVRAPLTTLPGSACQGYDRFPAWHVPCAGS